jgi:putative ABC transport system permease protein
VLRLRLRDLAEHPLRTAVTVAMVAVCSALAVSVVGLIASVRTTADRVAELAAGTADVEVAAGIGGATVPDTVLLAVAQVDGVAAVAPTVQATVAVAGHRALLLGGDARSLDFLPASVVDSLGAAGTPAAPGGGGTTGGPAPGAGPAATDDRPQVLLGARLAEEAGVGVGDEVPVQGAVAVEPAVVAGVLRDGAGVGSLVVSDLDDGMRLRGGAGYDRLLVAFGAEEPPGARTGSGVWAALDERGAWTGGAAARTRRALEEAVAGRAIVIDPGTRADDARSALAPLAQPLMLLAGLTLTVACVLVFNVVSLVVAERRRHLAIRCALGARRRWLWAGLVGEAVLLGALGGAAGALLGRALTGLMIASLPSALLEVALPTSIVVDVPLAVLAGGVVVGGGASGAAAAVAGRPLLTLSPLEAMGPRDVLGEPDPPVRRWLVSGGVGAVLAGTLAVAVAPVGLQLPATLVILDGVVALVWALRAPLAALVGAVARRAGSAGLLAALAVERSPSRSAMTALGALLPVAAVITLGGLQANTYDTARRAVSSLARDDLHVSAQDFSDGVQELALPAGLDADLAAIDGVSSIDRARFALVRVGGSEVLVEGVDPGTTAPIVRRATPAARRALTDDGAAIVSRAFARRRGVAAGDSFRVVTPNGPVDVPVAEVVGLIGWPAGFAAVSYDSLAVWSGTDRPTYVALRTDGPEADRAVRALVAARAPEGGIEPQVIDGDEAVGKSLLTQRQARGLFSALQGVVMASGAFAIVSTLVISTMGRTRELGLLRAVGARRRLVRRAVVIEAFAVTLTGAVLGVAVGSVFQYVAVRLASYSLGLPADFAFTPGPSAFALGASVLIAAVGALAALRRLLDLDVLDAVAYE